MYLELHLAGFVVRLINNSPRVEGNNITVDIDTDHPVQCGIRLAAMASPLRDCESMHDPFITYTQHSFICAVYLGTGSMAFEAIL